VEVLGWVRGRAVAPERLRRLFGRVQFLRTVNPYGFVSIQRFYIYAEQGLSRQRVSVWIYEGQLRLEYRETLVARYRCAYDQRRKRLHDVSHPMLYYTVFASPQLELIELDDAQWIKVQQRALQRRTPRRTTLGEQLMLAGLETSALLFLYLQAVGDVGRNCFPHMSVSCEQIQHADPADTTRRDSPNHAASDEPACPDRPRDHNVGTVAGGRCDCRGRSQAVAGLRGL
jgi:hypothetical protein